MLKDPIFSVASIYESSTRRPTIPTGEGAMRGHEHRQAGAAQGTGLPSTCPAGGREARSLCSAGYETAQRPRHNPCEISWAVPPTATGPDLGTRLVHSFKSNHGPADLLPLSPRQFAVLSRQGLRASLRTLLQRGRGRPLSSPGPFARFKRSDFRRIGRGAVRVGFHSHLCGIEKRPNPSPTQKPRAAIQAGPRAMSIPGDPRMIPSAPKKNRSLFFP